MKKKVIINVIILASLLLVVVGGILGLFIIRNNQIQNNKDKIPYIAIIKDNNIYEEIEYKKLTEKKEIIISDPKFEKDVVIVVYENGAFFKSSFCPDKLCVKRGVINEESLFTFSTCIFANITIELRYK